METAMPSAVDVVRSVFDTGTASKMPKYRVDTVLRTVKSCLMDDNNNNEPQTPECSTSPLTSKNNFWFVLSSTGDIEYVSTGIQQLLGHQQNLLTGRDLYSIVSTGDHHMVEPILNSGPSTSMSCKMRLLTVDNHTLPFVVTFAKLSTPQLFKKAAFAFDRSCTLCLAKSIIKHGYMIVDIDQNLNISSIDNKLERSLSVDEIIGKTFMHCADTADSEALEYMMQAEDRDLSCEVNISIMEKIFRFNISFIGFNNNNNRRFMCLLEKITSKRKNRRKTVDERDQLAIACSSLLTNDMTSPEVESLADEDIKDPMLIRRQRPLTVSSNPAEKDPVLRQLLGYPSQSEPESVSLDYMEHDQLFVNNNNIFDMSTYHGSTMPAPHSYMTNGMPSQSMSQPGYGPIQCSSYIQPTGLCPPEYQMSQQAHMLQQQNWPHPEYYQHTQQNFPTTTAKTLKRKAPHPERQVHNFPQNTNAFNFPQNTGLETPAMPEGTMNNHLSPYRFSNGSASYWPANGRPPSRSELIRMELRSSLQAKQLANQQRLPAMTPGSDGGSMGEPHSNTPSIGSDSLGFELDVVFKDSDGSLMDTTEMPIYDFKLGDGCGFQFDMENDATRCLVMKLLS